MSIYVVLFFIIGVFFGSFFNVLIDRIPREEEFMVGRSHCDFCGHTLSWYDLFPLFSFILLKGKCRYCHTFIGWKYPVIEVTTGLCFAFTASQSVSASPIETILLLGIIGCILIIFYTDLFSGIIPDIILIPLFLLEITRFFVLHQAVFPVLVSFLGAGLFFLSLFFITRRKGIGLGDVKYAFAMGILLGFPGIIIGLYIAFLTGAMIALILIVERKKKFGSAIAFGPFLVLGTFIALFWGTPLWDLIKHIIGL